MKIPHKFGHIRVNFLQSVRLQVTQSMNLIWPSMWSGGVLTHNTTREVEIYSNKSKRNIAKN